MNPEGGKPAGFKAYRTMSQNFYGYDTSANAVGESNQGIVSERAKNIHVLQMS